MSGQVVRDAVAAAVGERYGPLLSWQGPFAQSWSWQFRTSTARQRLVVKVPRWPGAGTLDAALAAGPQPDTAAEFAALENIQRMVALAGDPGLAAVVPVGYLAEVNAIVMEEFPGRSLRQRLGGRSPDRAEEWFARLGSWLGHYHRSGGEMTAFAADSRVHSWEGAARRPSRHPQLVAAATRAAHRLEGRPGGAGMVHGDLTLSNVLVDDSGRVAVIDPNRIRGRWECDAAHVLGEVAFGRSQMATAGLLRRPTVVERWAGALCAGHGGLDAGILGYERAAHVLDRMLDESGPRRFLATPLRRGAEVRRRFDAG